MELKRGAKGVEVRELQAKLHPEFYRARVDGDFGPLTEAALKSFQTQRFVTGILDEITSTELDTWDEVSQGLIELIVPVPRDRAELVRTFGRIEYRDLKKGQITITNGWARDNMVKVDLPVVGKKWIHRKLESHFVRALSNVQHLGLAGKIETFGTWCPRHILHDSSKELSLHSWGIAVDINAKRYRYGSKKRLPRKLVRCFTDEGFFCGENFSTPDPMHFQYLRYR